MSRRVDTLLTTAALAASMCLAGCNGPTKTGVEARNAARDRLDLFNAQLGYDQAKQLFEVGRLERALRVIDDSITQYPERGQYHVLKGRIYFEMHRLEQSIESFMTAMDLDPDDPEAYYFAGIVFQRWSDDEQAYDNYSRAAELDPAVLHYLLAAAESLVAMGEFESARTLLETNMSYFEHNAAVHHLIGQIALMEGDNQEAVKRYTKARLLNPDDETLLEEMARVQYVAEDYQGCYESVRQIHMIADEPRTDMMLLEARCLALLGRNTEARSQYTKLSQHDPTNVDVWIEFGTIAWELEDFHRVAQCGARIVSLAAEHFEGYMLRGIAERHRKRLQAAIDAFRDAVSRADDTVIPHILLGMTLEEQGQREEALKAYRQALSIDPQNAQANALFQRLVTTQAVSSAPTGG